MQVSVDVTDEMRREAESRGMPIIDYVDFLIAKGRPGLQVDAAVCPLID
jgi:hypothetical protein